MIVEAKYVGPLPRVIIPGTTKKVAERGQVVPIRVSDMTVLGGCWEITKGQKEYEAHVAAIDADIKARAEAKIARRKKAAGVVEQSEKVGERSATKTDTTKGKKE